MLAKQVSSGVVTINNHGFTAAIPGAPWSGVRGSGTGVTNSLHVLSELTRPKFVLSDSSRGKTELWWYPYTPALRAIASSLAVLRGAGVPIARIEAVGALVGAFPKRLLGGLPMGRLAAFVVRRAEAFRAGPSGAARCATS